MEELEKEKRRWEEESSTTLLEEIKKSMNTILENRINKLKSELSFPPLNTSGLGIQETIGRDIEFRKLGYISEWDAKKDTIEELENILRLTKN